MKSNKNKRGFLYLILAFLALKGLFFMFKKEHKKLKEIEHNLKNFFKEEKREVEELKNGQESFKKYCSDSACLFKDYFIPHNNNNHKPKILHTKSLVVIVVFLAILKVSLTGYLFFSYPFQARMVESISQAVFQMVNYERENLKLSILRLDSVLSASAMAKAEDMLSQSYFAHHSPDGKKPWDWIDRGQYKYLFVGENLAMNFTSAESAHKALMNSPTHKKNILNDRYDDVGLAMASGMMNGKKINVLVQLFATKQSAQTKLAAAKQEINPLADLEQGAGDEVAVLGEDKTQDIKTTEEPPTKPIEEEPVVKPIVEPIKEEPVKTEIIEPEPKKIVSAGVSSEEKTVELEPISDEDKKLLATIDTDMNQILSDDLPTEVLAFKNSIDGRMAITAKVAKVVNYIFMSALMLMVLALFTNIVVRIRVQHKHVIIQTMLVILFITSLIYFKLHVLESGLSEVLVLGL